MTFKKLKNEVDGEAAAVKLKNLVMAQELGNRLNNWFDLLNKFTAEGLAEEEAGLVIDSVEKVTSILQPDQKSLAEDLADRFGEIKHRLLAADENHAPKRIYQIEQRFNQLIEPENYPTKTSLEICQLKDLRTAIKEVHTQTTEALKKRLTPVIS
jgi:predicted S18 family serine protease